MSQKITEEVIKAIEKVLNKKGRKEAVIKIESGKPVVIEVTRKKVN